MQNKILALIEDNIGTKLLLETRLQALGYQITILSSAVAFQRQVEVEDFDWILLDDAALPPVRWRLLEHLGRHRKGARLVWCGKTPRQTSVPIEATFAKPLRYSEIAGFFSRWMRPGEELAEGEAGGSREGTVRGGGAGTSPCTARNVSVIQSNKRGKKTCMPKKS